MDPVTYFSVVVADLIIKDLRSQDDKGREEVQPRIPTCIETKFKPQRTKSKNIRNIIGSKAGLRKRCHRKNSQPKETSLTKSSKGFLPIESEEMMVRPCVTDNNSNPLDKGFRLHDLDLLELEFKKLQFLQACLNSSMISQESFKKCFLESNFSGRKISVSLRYRNHFNHVHQCYKALLASNPSFLKFRGKRSHLKMFFSFIIHFGITALLSVLLKGALNHLTHRGNSSNISADTMSLIEFCINIAALTDFSASTFELVQKLLKESRKNQSWTMDILPEKSSNVLSLNKINKQRWSFFKSHKFRGNFFMNNFDSFLRPYEPVGFATIMKSAIEAFIYQP